MNSVKIDQGHHTDMGLWDYEKHYPSLSCVYRAFTPSGRREGRGREGVTIQAMMDTA